MKNEMHSKILMVILVLVCGVENLKAQTFRENGTAASDTTIAVGRRLKIEFASRSIYPNPYDGVAQKKLASGYLASEMEGNYYSVYRVKMRKARNGEMKQIAEILIKTNANETKRSQIYWIEIDQAVSEGAISFERVR